MIALCEGLQTCPDLEKLSLGEEEEDRDGDHQVASLLCSALCHSQLSCPSMRESPSILFEANNRHIGIEGWAAVGRALFSKKNFKKLDLGKESVNESSYYPERKLIVFYPLIFLRSLFCYLSIVHLSIVQNLDLSEIIIGFYSSLFLSFSFSTSSTHSTHCFVFSPLFNSVFVLSVTVHQSLPHSIFVRFCPFLPLSRTHNAAEFPSHWLSVHFLTDSCNLDSEKMVALCEGLQACPALEELVLGE
jgi:hypothetical protein